MLNPFPDLLWLGVFGPFIIRIGLACFFALASFNHIKRRRARFEQVFNAKLGQRGASLLRVVGAYEAIVGLGFLVGFLTQIVSLLALLYVLFALYKRERDIFGYDIILYVLVLAMALSLLLTGAGPLAFDIPL